MSPWRCATRRADLAEAAVTDGAGVFTLPLPPGHLRSDVHAVRVPAGCARRGRSRCRGRRHPSTASWRWSSRGARGHGRQPRAVAVGDRVAGADPRLPSCGPWFPPSTSPRIPISDAAKLVRPASIHNLAHEHTLVLVNGSAATTRRSIAWFAGVTDGSQGPGHLHDRRRLDVGRRLAQRSAPWTSSSTRCRHRLLRPRLQPDVRRRRQTDLFLQLRRNLIQRDRASRCLCPVE